MKYKRLGPFLSSVEFDYAQESNSALCRLNREEEENKSFDLSAKSNIAAVANEPEDHAPVKNANSGNNRGNGSKAILIIGILIACIVVIAFVVKLGYMSTSSTDINDEQGWGPEREIYTMALPADHPVFNSITDNPVLGDERYFLRIGSIESDETNLRNEIQVEPGKQYLVYVYFHNNASSSLNDSEHDYAGVAVKTTMSVLFPAVITPDEPGYLRATISSENSNPESVWSSAKITTKTDSLYLQYVAGSAKIYNDWDSNGTILSSNLFSEEGTLLGLNELNGIIPGCDEYHGAVSFVVQAYEV